MSATYLYSKLPEDKMSDDFDSARVWRKQRPWHGWCNARPLNVALRVVSETCALAVLYVLIAMSFSNKFTPRIPLGYAALPEVLRKSPTNLVIFEPHPDFDGYSDTSAAAWASLKAEKGFISVDNAAELGLPPGIDKNGTDYYAISAFHQIHCLISLRAAYYENKKEIVESVSSKSHHQLRSPHDPPQHVHGRHDKDPHPNHHLNHCWDYLRQAVMCTADPAIEFARVTSAGDRLDVDGWGIEHQCRSWERLVNFVST